MSAFDGARVALLEARMSRELSDLVERFGGRPYSVPALREVPIEDESVAPFLNALGAGRVSLVIFQTGVGVTTLLREAERLGRLADALRSLRRTTIACRGPKPAAVLRKYDVPIHANAASPYTSRELLDVLHAIDLAGKSVALVHYGERNRELADALELREANLEELCLYAWRLPEDLRPLGTLVRELIDGRVDAIAFTSQIQCRHLFRIAGDLASVDDLTTALNTRTVVAAIGPVCAASLQALGVMPHVMPANPKMGPLIAALADYFQLTKGLFDRCASHH